MNWCNSKTLRSFCVWVGIYFLVHPEKFIPLFMVVHFLGKMCLIVSVPFAKTLRRKMHFEL